MGVISCEKIIKYIFFSHPFFWGIHQIRPFNIDIFIVEDILIAVRYASNATDLLVNRLIFTRK